jgi:probable dihydroxyacetone kinase regulator
MSSSLTKNIIAESLRKALEKKPLNKITVSEIVADCGINRKTFYYHFEDLYDLLRWMLKQDTVEVLDNNDLWEDPRGAIRYILTYIEENKHILNCVYDSMGRDAIKNYFYDDFNKVILTQIERDEQHLGISVPDDYKSFLCSYCTEALAGMLVEGLKTPGKLDKNRIIDYVMLILESTIPAALQAAAN